MSIFTLLPKANCWREGGGGGGCFKYLFDVLRAPREVNKQTVRFHPEVSAEAPSPNSL